MNIASSLCLGAIVAILFSIAMSLTKLNINIRELIEVLKGKDKR